MKKISFDNFNERGLKPLADELKKHDQNVASIKATNVPKREDGFQIKSAMFTFDSGQKLEIKIKADGSIYQVRLNGKVIPVKNSQDIDEPANLKKAVREVADRIKQNEAAYTKQMARRMKKVKDTGPRASTSVTKRLAETKEVLSALQENSKVLDESLAGARGDVEAKRAELESLRAELEQEIQRGETLRAELEALAA
jgi:chromosome segregation ATPase